MESKNIVKLINYIIDDQARTTVGVLCKKIEVLERNKTINPALYKDLIKETIYEQFRALKKNIEYAFIPKVNFVSKKEDKNG